MIQSRRGEAIIELVRGDGSRVDGIMLAAHRDYNAIRAGSLPAPRVPAGLFAVRADFASEGERGFSSPYLDERTEVRVLRELPGLLRQSGWTDARAILILGDFSGYAGEGENQRWEALTTDLAGLAEVAGVSVFFPGQGSRAEYPHEDRYPLVVGGDDPRWLRADPPSGPREAARPAYVQDPAGQLWLRIRRCRNGVLATGRGRPG